MSLPNIIVRRGKLPSYGASLVRVVALVHEMHIVWVFIG